MLRRKKEIILARFSQLEISLLRSGRRGPENELHDVLTFKFEEISRKAVKICIPGFWNS